MHVIDLLINIHQTCFTGIGAIVQLYDYLRISEVILKNMCNIADNSRIRSYREEYM